MGREGGAHLKVCNRHLLGGDGRTAHPIPPPQLGGREQRVAPDLSAAQRRGERVAHTTCRAALLRVDVQQRLIKDLRNAVCMQRLLSELHVQCACGVHAACVAAECMAAHSSV